jgi:hypothetical protein
MLIQLAISSLMVLLTVAIHGSGLLMLARLLRLERKDEKLENISPTSLQGIAATFGVVLGLFLLHGIEIWLYAALYLVLDAMPDLQMAVYFSTITYATIGYDDKGLPEAWSLIAAIEGVNGVILLGWSTAFFVSLVGRLYKR